MAQKRAKAQPEPTPQEEFWTSDALAERERVKEHMARLQRRQMELVQQTAQELEELRQQLDSSHSIEDQVRKARQPLVAEINDLRTRLALAETQKNEAMGELEKIRFEYQSHYAQMQGALSALKNAIRSQARSFDQQVRVFSLDATQTLESMLGSVENASVPSVEFKPTPIAQAVHVTPTPLPLIDEPLVVLEEVPAFLADEPKKRKERRERRSWKLAPTLRRLAVRGVAFALVISGGYAAFHTFAQSASSITTGTVAGASTGTDQPNPSPTDLNEEHKEAYNVVPFEQTEWQTITDPDFGVSIRYPKNTSSLIRTVGGSNIWFMRFDGYLMRISTEDTSDLLDAWWQKSQGFYLDDNTASKGIFKGQPAWIIKPKASTDTTGTTYAIQRKTGGILTVWVKDVDPNSDDGKRLMKMVDSLTISS